MFSTSAFAEAVSINGAPGEGIFDAPYNDPTGMIESSAPTLTIITADFPAVEHGDAVTVRGITRAVVGIEPDLHGVTVLRIGVA